MAQYSLYDSPAWKRARRYAMSLIADAIRKGDFDAAVEHAIQYAKIVRSSVERSYDMSYKVQPKQIDMSFVYNSALGYSTIELYALSHRLKRRIVVSLYHLRGHRLLKPILREFAYLPAMQYMFDTHIQMPSIWRRLLIGEDAAILAVDGTLKGVRFEISDVYAVEFYPLKLGSVVRPDRAVEVPQNAQPTRYIRQAYTYLSKISHSKISALMTQAFGGDVKVSYVVTNVSEFKPSESSVSLFVTVPSIKHGVVTAQLNLIVRVTMLNGAEIRFVDNTVSTYPVLFKDAKKYLPSAPSSNVVISPTTLSMLLTHVDLGDENGNVSA